MFLDLYLFLTNRNLLRELNLQTNQTKSQISIASNIETCSNQLSPKKRGGKRLPREENGKIKNNCFYTLHQDKTQNIRQRFAIITKKEIIVVIYSKISDVNKMR
ncbi:hypothetical protein BpHYR1_043504 [Brachionus plicatilis]|uniref:Uncharacterized protein n=1 Tax=Brachionus plicatilis TaxID=10195 RepID=A0A3M7RF10_BRAPC|nr:hypothetical protein BpHYR1_043504 [Brachionus plicatilis]